MNLTNIDADLQGQLPFNKATHLDQQRYNNDLQQPDIINRKTEHNSQTIKDTYFNKFQPDIQQVPSRNIITGIFLNFIPQTLEILLYCEDFLIQRNSFPQFSVEDFQDNIREFFWKQNITVSEEDILCFLQDFSFASLDFEREKHIAYITKIFEKLFISKHQTNLKINEFRFVSVEKFFFEQNNLAEIVHKCIKNAPIDNRKEMFQNIFIAGSVCLINGFDKKLKFELLNVFNDQYKRDFQDQYVYEKNWLNINKILEIQNLHITQNIEEKNKTLQTNNQIII
ncbi:Actin related protein [Spironucleus salmonicida]|uniref:Actin related protein n=1 Tax=Spironucleus salmonicida TaxID=348837 RepID=V6LN16_9EUKA|nr:Actin related protein [Spironucleus salmonicida]|eukprot:EST46015.1 Actin related protein [Spironucleus salmonicida]